MQCSKLPIRTLTIAIFVTVADVEVNQLWVAPEFNIGPPFPNLEVLDLADENTAPGKCSLCCQCLVLMCESVMFCSKT